MDMSNFWLPENLSVHGPAIDHLIIVIHWFMAALFVGWGVYFAYCLFAFRERPGHDSQPAYSAKHFKLPTYLEVAVMLFEVFLLVFLSSPIWFAYKNDIPNEKDAVVIHVTAEQFAWNIHYPGKDGKFGPTKLDLISGTNPLGLDRDDAAGKDDITEVNILHVPVNKPILIYLSSKDVIHSFFLPLMRVKQDAVPGVVVPIWFTATKTGEFDIQCAQLCGISHYTMKGRLFVDTPEQYQKFLDDEAAAQVVTADASAPGAEGSSK